MDTSGPLARHDVVHLRADNPGPFTLSGTNTYVVGRDPAWVVDPGPALDEHVAAVRAAVAARGGLGGIAVTHDHRDHTEAIDAVRDGADVEVAIGTQAGAALGPFTVVTTPGHAPDHVVFLYVALAFTGDTVLGEGSVFISPDPGALRGYLRALEQLRDLGLDALCPGHGPIVLDARAKLTQYLDHRRDRERRLIDALDEGARSVEALLDTVWSDAPAVLRPAAAVTLAAHLDKLAEEGTLPAGVERPAWPPQR